MPSSRVTDDASRKASPVPKALPDPERKDGHERAKTTPPQQRRQPLRSMLRPREQPPRARWEALLLQWQPSCETAAARRSRRAWRRKALELVVECGGVPRDLRRRVWLTVLGSAVESQRLADVPQQEHDDEAKAAQMRRDSDEPRWARSNRRNDDGRASPRLLPREIALDVKRTFPLERNADDHAKKLAPPPRKKKASASSLGGSGGSGGGSGGGIAKHYVEETRLRRLLTHFARTSPAVQYYQGMNFLGGTLLRVFEEPVVVVPTNDATTLAAASTAGTRPRERQRSSGDSVVSFSSSSAEGGVDATTTTTTATQQQQNAIIKRKGGKRKEKSSRRKETSSSTSPSPSPPPVRKPLLRSTTIDAATATSFKGLMALVTPLYVPDFLGLRELVSVANAVLPRFCPKLSSVLRAESLDLMPILAPWCLTLFSSTAMDSECVLCCWDFLVVGTPSRREELMLANEDDEDDYAFFCEEDHDDDAANGGDDAAHAATTTQRTWGGTRTKGRSRSLSMEPLGAAFGGWAPSSAGKPSRRHTASSQAQRHSHTDSSSSSLSQSAGHVVRFASMRRQRRRPKDDADVEYDGSARKDLDFDDAAATPPQGQGPGPGKKENDRTDDVGGTDDDDDDASPTTTNPPPTTPPTTTGKRTTTEGAPPPQQQQQRVFETPSPTRRTSSAAASSSSAPVVLEKNSTSERLTVLLRLCLVMLKLGERATWGGARPHDSRDDLESLSELLEAAQPSPVSDDARPRDHRRASYCFPENTATLCALFAKTKLDGRVVRSQAKRFRKDHADEFEALLDQSHHLTTPVQTPQQPAKIRPENAGPPSLALRLFRRVSRPLSAVFRRRRRRTDATTKADLPLRRRPATGDPSLHTY